MSLLHPLSFYVIKPTRSDCPLYFLLTRICQGSLTSTNFKSKALIHSLFRAMFHIGLNRCCFIKRLEDHEGNIADGAEYVSEDGG